MPSHFWNLLLIGAVAAHATSVLAACDAKSGSVKVPLLELYTSEGCSSCPPADRWLTELLQQHFAQARVVALAFHVDYWNYLGWTDRFAQPLFSARQSEFGRMSGAKTIYTPEFLLDGAEYRRWSTVDLKERLAGALNDAPGADLTLQVDRAGVTLHVSGSATLRERTSARAYLAVYENNLQSDVHSGENRGRTLKHAFVVRRLLGPFAFDETGTAHPRVSIKLAPDWKLSDLGVAAFVQEAAGPRILQALALSTCR